MYYIPLFILMKCVHDLVHLSMQSTSITSEFSTQKDCIFFFNIWPNHLKIFYKAGNLYIPYRPHLKKKDVKR